MLTENENAAQGSAGKDRAKNDSGSRTRTIRPEADSRLCVTENARHECIIYVLSVGTMVVTWNQPTPKSHTGHSCIPTNLVAMRRDGLR